MMRPYSQAELNNPKRIFNYRLSRARHIIDNASGILNARFGVFQRSTGVSPDQAKCVVLA